MELIADGMLIAAAATAALYCWILSRRLNALRDLDKGLGGAIAGLSAQVDETRASLADAKSVTHTRSRELGELTARAEIAAGRLEMLLAALHEGGTQRPVAAETVRAARDRKDAPVIPEPPPEQPRASTESARTRDDAKDALINSLRGLTEMVKR